MSIFGDIFSGIGAIVGQGAKKKQLEFEKQKYATEKALALRQAALAEQLARQGVATRTDGSGNTTYYDSASNSWKTILSPEQKQLQDTSDQEQLQRLGVDATGERNQRTAAAGVRADENQRAAAAGAQLTDVLSGRGAADPTKLASALALSRRGAISQGLNDYDTQLGTQALRSGASGLDRVGSALAIARARAVAEGMGNPTVEADQLARQQNSDKVAQLSGLYNGFAARGSGVPDAGFSGADVSGALRNGAASQAQDANSATSGSALAIANAQRGLGAAANPDFVKGSSAGLYAGFGNLIDNVGKDVVGAFTGGGGIGGTIAGLLGGSRGSSGGYPAGADQYGFNAPGYAPFRATSSGGF